MNNLIKQRTCHALLVAIALWLVGCATCQVRPEGPRITSLARVMLASTADDGVFLAQLSSMGKGIDLQIPRASSLAAIAICVESDGSYTGWFKSIPMGVDVLTQTDLITMNANVEVTPVVCGKGKSVKVAAGHLRIFASTAYSPNQFKINFK